MTTLTERLEAATEGSREITCPRCGGKGVELPSFSANYFIPCRLCRGARKIVQDIAALKARGL